MKYTIFKLKKIIYKSIHILLILNNLSQLHIYNTLIKIINILPPKLKL